ncbi:MAG: hypothetical protein GOVbin1807_33 [Prokaryotic dsDNA virus sp.]|nr:MAG: hypothetical protein GOVbin1807_33 [Prokaryotic dsDNA virus sp.]|tara:strand:+ start:732 stop:2267 length:1536 start_codon:yes stop_codon:yes gene_type:complete
MKLDEKEIEKLIEELLQERNVKIRNPQSSESDADYLQAISIGPQSKSKALDADLSKAKGNEQPFDNDAEIKAAIIALRDLVGEPNNTIDLGDFARASELDDDAPAKKMAQWLSQNANRAKDRSEYGGYFPQARDYGDEATQDLASPGDSPKQQEIDPDKLPFSDPKIYSASGGAGQFGGKILSSFSSFFESMGAASLQDRIIAISQVSKAMISEDTTVKLKNLLPTHREQLNAAICMDYMAALFKEFDHGAGAYFFEMFAGMITGGIVSGKGMKGDDFIMVSDGGDALEGSTKFFSATKEADQALSGFTEGVEVNYLFAWKRSGGAVGSVSSTAEPDEILEIDLYQFSITKNSDGSVTASGDVSASVTGGQNPKVLFDMKSSSGVPVTTTLYLANVSGRQGFKTALESGLKKEEKGLQDAYEHFKKYIENMQLSSQLTKSYIADGRTTDATESISKLKLADTSLKNLYKSGDSKAEGFGRKVSRGKVSESKFESLDKLIAETMRDIRKKRK